MPVCRSMDQLKQALQERLVQAVDNMAQMVLDDVDDATMHYYQSYSPWLYDRTGTLSYAPRKTSATETGDGAQAQVYMDTSLGYHTGSWSMADVISAADSLTHGGKKVGEGVSIWAEPIKTAQGNSRSMWLRAMRDAGLPVN